MSLMICHFAHWNILTCVRCSWCWNCPYVSNGGQPRRHRQHSRDVTSKRLKHGDMKYHFLHELVESEELKVEYVPSNANIANFLVREAQTTYWYEWIDYERCFRILPVLTWSMLMPFHSSRRRHNKYVENQFTLRWSSELWAGARLFAFSVIFHDRQIVQSLLSYCSRRHIRSILGKDRTGHLHLAGGANGSIAKCSLVPDRLVKAWDVECQVVVTSLILWDEAPMLESMCLSFIGDRGERYFILRIF